jgi:hypothetical protein
VIYVEIHEGKNQTGTIGWNGRHYVVSPPDDTTLLEILGESLLDPQTQDVVGSDDPERFLNCLQFQYRSPYFRASAPVRN